MLKFSAAPSAIPEADMRACSAKGRRCPQEENEAQIYVPTSMNPSRGSSIHNSWSVLAGEYHQYAHFELLSASRRGAQVSAVRKQGELLWLLSVPVSVHLPYVRRGGVWDSNVLLWDRQDTKIFREMGICLFFGRWCTEVARA
eukprot:1891923-Amphidinium_carterae.1